MIVIAFATLAAGASLSAQQALPAGPGADVIRARCLGCHDADLIVSQRLASAGWTRELDKMARWGAVLSVEQRVVLHAYLVANFAPKPLTVRVSNDAAPGAGEAAFRRACLSCHGVDLVEQQRLSRAAWVRAVEKMMRWGASVSAAEKDPLVDHLAERWGPDGSSAPVRSR